MARFLRTVVNDLIVVNSKLYLKKIIDYALDSTRSGSKNSAAYNIVYKGDQSNDWSKFISEFLVVSENHTHHGVLTKLKIEELTKANSGRLMEQIYDTIGKKLCVIGGKAGTGKTLALMRVLYNEVRKGDDAPKHNCRLLTYNNMLVADIKQLLKHVGEFTKTKVSVSTLHKFIFDIYKNSAVSELHMDREKIEKLFTVCMDRVTKVNYLIKKNSFGESLTITKVKEILKSNQDKILKSEVREIDGYVSFLGKNKEIIISELTKYASQYVLNKRNVFEENYHRSAFLNGYNEILKELYLIYHNLDEFVEKYGLNIAYSRRDVLNQKEFRQKYQALYNDFIRNAEESFKDENTTETEYLSKYQREREILENEISNYIERLPDEEKKEHLQEKVKQVKRKVNWSKYILVDEAQDCQIYEKALLLELNGSNDTIIATGGKDQLIRRSEENDWTVLFGNNLDCQKITLRNVSRRQKGNIVEFLNAFALVAELDTQLSIPDEIKNKGRVIIDCRTIGKRAPVDIIQALYKSGMDYGCSNFENIMFMLPRLGYVEREADEHDVDIIIDENDTVLINQNAGKRSMSIQIPEKLHPIDGTINDKRVFVEKVGQDNTRCILYDSCRGLEAWNIMCIDFDTFYYEKYSSSEAEEYGTVNGGGLFDESTDLYKKRFASLWCYMAMTRAMDTLYIKLANTYSEFSINLLNAARKLPFVEILEGEYIDNNYQNEV